MAPSPVKDEIGDIVPGEFDLGCIDERGFRKAISSCVWFESRISSRSEIALMAKASSAAARWASVIAKAAAVLVWIASSGAVHQVGAAALVSPSLDNLKPDLSVSSRCV